MWQLKWASLNVIPKYIQNFEAAALEFVSWTCIIHSKSSHMYISKNSICIVMHVKCNIEILSLFRLEHCSLTDKSCAAVASAAHSTACILKELNLSGNNVLDLGVEYLSDLLKNAHCKLEKLEWVLAHNDRHVKASYAWGNTGFVSGPCPNSLTHKLCCFCYIWLIGPVCLSMCDWLLCEMPDL